MKLNDGIKDLKILIGLILQNLPVLQKLSFLLKKKHRK
jgi:hypothetical protein